MKNWKRKFKNGSQEKTSDTLGQVSQRKSE